MSDSDTKFYTGQVVFDKKRTDPTDDLLVVFDHDVGMLKDIADGQTRRLVRENDVNKELYNGPVPDSEPVVKAVYLSENGSHPASVGNQVYTFPEERLETPESDSGSALGGFHPYQFTLAEFFAELAEALDQQDITVESVEDLQVLCMEASVDGAVITRGTSLGLDKQHELPNQ